MKIFITSDHGGFNLKTILINNLKININELKLKISENEALELIDLGPYTLDPTDDYPIYAKKLAEEIQKNQNSQGIIMCRNGEGVAIASNKFDGIRCALVFNEKHAISAKNDDNANVISLPADYISETEATNIVNAFLLAKFKNEDRFKRRLDELKKIEETN